MVSLKERQVHAVDTTRPVRFVGDNLDRLLDLLARARAVQSERDAAAGSSLNRTTDQSCA